MEDYIILVDKQKNILGTAPKLDSHNGTTPLHLAFSVFLFNKKGEVLLQQRSHKKKTWPLIWSNSCCGHQKLNEDLAVTVASRVRFELNMDVKHLQVMLPNFRYRCEKDGIVENEICPVFVGVVDENTTQFNGDEVENIRWISWGNWRNEIEKNPETYSYWSIEETKQLTNNNKFSNFLSSLSANI